MIINSLFFSNFIITDSSSSQTHIHTVFGTSMATINTVSTYCTRINAFWEHQMNWSKNGIHIPHLTANLCIYFIILKYICEASRSLDWYDSKSNPDINTHLLGCSLTARARDAVFHVVNRYMYIYIYRVHVVEAPRGQYLADDQHFSRSILEEYYSASADGAMCDVRPSAPNATNRARRAII